MVLIFSFNYVTHAFATSYSQGDDTIRLLRILPTEATNGGQSVTARLVIGAGCMQQRGEGWLNSCLQLNNNYY